MPGYADSYRGWYDVQGCGKCNDYCRWVGNTGSGGDPATKLSVGSKGSYWSCRLAGSSKSLSPRNYFKTFTYKKCSSKGASAPASTSSKPANAPAQHGSCPVCTCQKPKTWPFSGCDVTCGAKCGTTCCCIPGVGNCGKGAPAPASTSSAPASTGGNVLGNNMLGDKMRMYGM